MRAYDKVIRVVKRISMLESVKEVLLWDQRTFMPINSADLRSQEIVAITTAIHRNITSHFLKNIRSASKEELTDLERVNLNEIIKNYLGIRQVRQSIITRLEETKVLSRSKWVEAREKNSFPIISKPFKKILNLLSIYAKSINSKRSCYETLLSSYEPDFSVKEISDLFTSVRQDLIDMRSNLVVYSNSFKDATVKRTVQKKFISFMLERIGYDLSRGRIDFAERAFSGANGRIVVRTGASWMGNLFTALHEMGHSLHNHNLPVAYMGTPLGSAGSYSLRESQALIWQNYIGAERSFWSYFYPQLKETYKLPFNIDVFLEMLDSGRDFTRRIGSDRINYALHIILRFELEQTFFDEGVTSSKLKKKWDSKFKELFGTKSSSLLKDSFLQDIHWFVGSIGYFPAYLLGEFIAAQLYHKMKQDIPNFDDKLSSGSFSDVVAWLTKNIYSSGRRYTTKELVKRVTGEELNPKYYLDSLRDTYF